MTVLCVYFFFCIYVFFFFQAEDGIRDYKVTGVQTCALPIWIRHSRGSWKGCRKPREILVRRPRRSILDEEASTWRCATSSSRREWRCPPHRACCSPSVLPTRSASALCVTFPSP